MGRKIIVKVGKKFFNNLSEVVKETGVETGKTKINSASDLNYIAPVLNPLECPTTYYDKITKKEIVCLKII